MSDSLHEVKSSEEFACRLGRVNPRFPPEYLLAQFLEPLYLIPMGWEFNTTSTAACQWYGVQCDADQRVTNIDWSHIGMKNKVKDETLRWERLPATLLSLSLYRNDELSRSLPLECLPQQMVGLHLTTNLFSGTLDLSCVPHTMQHMGLALNRFKQALHFDALPQGLKTLSLKYNFYLRGTYDLTTLPSGLVLDQTFFTDSTLLADQAHGGPSVLSCTSPLIPECVFVHMDECRIV